ncbi:MAG: TspO/MBR family protein [Pseudomonadota bacterium]
MSYLVLAVFVVLVVITAVSGAVYKPGEWYDTLEKPSWTPPDWAFPVVWSILYLMIAVAGWLVWEKVGWSLAIVLWGAQLVLNATWSWLFFGRRRMDQAFIDVTLLWLCIAAFIIVAWPISTLAAVLFLPYLLWVTIAGALNRTVWRMNPEATAP